MAKIKEQKSLINERAAIVKEALKGLDEFDTAAVMMEAMEGRQNLAPMYILAAGGEQVNAAKVIIKTCAGYDHVSLEFRAANGKSIDLSKVAPK